VSESLTYIKHIFDGGTCKNLAEIFEIKHYTPDFTFGPHSHENIEMNYVHTGKCYLKIDGKVIPFKKGDCMILYPNIHHFFFTTKERAVLVQLEFKLGIFPQMAPVLELEKNLLFLYQLLTNSQQVIKISNNDEINRVIQKAVKELNEKKRNYRIITRLYFAELFILISRELDKKLKFTGLKINPKAEALLQHIQNNYYQNIDLEQFALKMGVSSRHLRKLFKLNFGISPVSYLLEFRINKALELLNDPKLNVKEVAFETGFTTPQYFSKKFREITGMSPRKYKKSLFRKI